MLICFFSRLVFEWTRRCETGSSEGDDEDCKTPPLDLKLWPWKGVSEKQDSGFSSDGNQGVYFRNEHPLLKSPFRPFSTRRQEHDPENPMAPYTPNPADRLLLVSKTRDMISSKRIEDVKSRREKVANDQRRLQSPFKPFRRDNMVDSGRQSRLDRISEEDAGDRENFVMGPSRNPYIRFSGRNNVSPELLQLKPAEVAAGIASMESYGYRPRNSGSRMQRTMRPPGQRNKQRPSETQTKEPRRQQHSAESPESPERAQKQGRDEQQVTQSGRTTRPVGNDKEPLHSTKTPRTHGGSKDQQAKKTHNEAASKTTVVQGADQDRGLSSKPQRKSQPPATNNNAPKGKQLLNRKDPKPVSNSNDWIMQAKDISTIAQKPGKNAEAASTENGGKPGLSKTNSLRNKAAPTVVTKQTPATSAPGRDRFQTSTAHAYVRNTVKPAARRSGPSSTPSAAAKAIVHTGTSSRKHQKSTRPTPPSRRLNPYRPKPTSSTSSPSSSTTTTPRLLQTAATEEESSSAKNATISATTTTSTRTSKATTVKTGWGPMQNNRFVTWIPATPASKWVKAKARHRATDKSSKPQLQSPFAKAKAKASSDKLKNTMLQKGEKKDYFPQAKASQSTGRKEGGAPAVVRKDNTPSVQRSRIPQETRKSPSSPFRQSQRVVNNNRSLSVRKDLQRPTGNKNAEGASKGVPKAVRTPSPVSKKHKESPFVNSKSKPSLGKISLGQTANTEDVNFKTKPTNRSSLNPANPILLHKMQQDWLKMQNLKTHFNLLLGNGETGVQNDLYSQKAERTLSKQSTDKDKLVRTSAGTQNEAERDHKGKRLDITKNRPQSALKRTSVASSLKQYITTKLPEDKRTTAAEDKPIDSPYKQQANARSETEGSKSRASFNSTTTGNEQSPASTHDASPVTKRVNRKETAAMSSPVKTKAKESKNSSQTSGVNSNKKKLSPFLPPNSGNTKVRALGHKESTKDLNTITETTASPKTTFQEPASSKYIKSQVKPERQSPFSKKAPDTKQSSGKTNVVVQGKETGEQLKEGNSGKIQWVRPSGSKIVNPFVLSTTQISPKYTKESDILLRAEKNRKTPKKSGKVNAKQQQNVQFVRPTDNDRPLSSNEASISSVKGSPFAPKSDKSDVLSDKTKVSSIKGSPSAPMSDKPGVLSNKTGAVLDKASPFAPNKPGVLSNKAKVSSVKGSPFAPKSDKSGVLSNKPGVVSVKASPFAPKSNKSGVLPNKTKVSSIKTSPFAPKPDKPGGLANQTSVVSGKISPFAPKADKNSQQGNKTPSLGFSKNSRFPNKDRQRQKQDTAKKTTFLKAVQLHVQTTPTTKMAVTSDVKSAPQSVDTEKEDRAEFSSVREESMKRVRTQTFRTPTAIMWYVTTHPAYTKTTHQLPKPPLTNIEIKVPNDVAVESTIQIHPSSGFVHHQEKKYRVPTMSSDVSMQKDYKKIVLERVVQQEKTEEKRKRKYRPGGLKSRLELVSSMSEKTESESNETKKHGNKSKPNPHKPTPSTQGTFELNGAELERSDKSDEEQDLGDKMNSVAEKPKLSPFSPPTKVRNNQSSFKVSVKRTTKPFERQVKPNVVKESSAVEKTINVPPTVGSVINSTEASGQASEIQRGLSTNDFGNVPNPQSGKTTKANDDHENKTNPLQDGLQKFFAQLKANTDELFNAKRKMKTTVVGAKMNSVPATSETKTTKHSNNPNSKFVPGSVLLKTYTKTNDSKKLHVNKISQAGIPYLNDISNDLASDPENPPSIQSPPRNFVIPDRTQTQATIILHQPKGRVSSLYTSGKNGSVVDPRLLNKERVTAAPRIGVKTRERQRHGNSKQNPGKTVSASAVPVTQHVAQSSNETRKEASEAISNSTIKTEMNLSRGSELPSTVVNKTMSDSVTSLSVEAVLKDSQARNRNLNASVTSVETSTLDVSITQANATADGVHLRVTDSPQTHPSGPQNISSRTNILQATSPSSSPDTAAFSKSRSSKLDMSSKVEAVQSIKDSLTTIKQNVHNLAAKHSTTSTRHTTSQPASTDSIVPDLEQNPAVAKTASAKSSQESSPAFVRYSVHTTTIDSQKITKSKNTTARANSPAWPMHSSTMSRTTGKTAPTTAERLTKGDQTETTLLRLTQGSATASTVFTTQSTTAEGQERTDSDRSTSEMKDTGTSEEIESKHTNSPTAASVTGETMTTILQTLRSKIDGISTTIKNMMYATSSMNSLSLNENATHGSLPQEIFNDSKLKNGNSSAVLQARTKTSTTTSPLSNSTILSINSTDIEANFTTEEPKSNQAVTKSAARPEDIVPLKAPKTNPLAALFSSLSRIISNSLGLRKKANATSPSVVEDLKTFVNKSEAAQNKTQTLPTPLAPNLNSSTTEGPERNSTGPWLVTASVNVSSTDVSAAAGRTVKPGSNLGERVTSTVASEGVTSVSNSTTASAENGGTSAVGSVSSSGPSSQEISTAGSTAKSTNVTSRSATQNQDETNGSTTPPEKSTTLKKIMLTLPDWVTFPNKFQDLVKKAGLVTRSQTSTTMTKTTTASRTTSANKVVSSTVIPKTTKKRKNKSKGKKKKSKPAVHKAPTVKPFLKGFMLNSLLPKDILSKLSGEKIGKKSNTIHKTQHQNTVTPVKVAKEDATKANEKKVDKKIKVAQDKKKLLKKVRVFPTLPSWKDLQNSSAPGPKVMVPKKGLFVPRFIHHGDDYTNGTQRRPGLSGSEARHVSLRVQQMSVGTVFSRYWPAILGLTVGTVFLVVALLTSLACRQQRSVV